MQKFIIKNPYKNTFNQYDTLKNMAASNGSSIFKYSDYESITDPTLATSYLYNLAANGKSLAERLPTQYNNSYITADEKATILNYIANLSGTVDTTSAVSQVYSSDETMNSTENAWAQWTVKNKFDGDYNKFLEVYNEKGYQGMLDEGYFGDMPEETFSGLSESTTKSTVDYMQQLASTTTAKAEAASSTSYQEYLEALDYNIAERKRYEAWQNASESEKVWSSIATIAALPITETGNIVEGVIDAVATVIGLFGTSEWREGVKTFVAKDIIPLDTLLYEALPNAYTTSPYVSNWNGWKIAYNVGSSMVDMAPLALNMVVPGLGTAIYYTSLSGRTAEDFIQQNPDLSIYAAAGYTIGSTAIEYMTENISGSDFFGSKGISEAFENFGSMNWFTKLIHNFIGEGMEEVISETGQGILYGAFTGDYSNLNIDNIGYAGVTGGIMGAIMSTSETIVSKVKVHNIKVYARLNGVDIPLNMNEIAIMQALSSGDDNIALRLAVSTSDDLSKLSAEDKAALAKTEAALAKTEDALAKLSAEDKAALAKAKAALAKIKDITSNDLSKLSTEEKAALAKILASLSGEDLKALAESRTGVLENIKEKYGNKFSDKQLITLARYYMEKAAGDAAREKFRKLKESFGKLKLVTTRKGKTVTTTYEGKTISEAVNDSIKTADSASIVSEQVKKIDADRIEAYDKLSDEEKKSHKDPREDIANTSELERAKLYGLIKSEATNLSSEDTDTETATDGKSVEEIDDAINKATENYKNAYSLYLWQLQQQFGEDTVVAGTKWFYGELEATTDRLLQISNSTPDTTKSGTAASKAASDAFNSPIVVTKTDNAKELQNMFNAAIHRKGTKTRRVYTFVNTKANIPAIFVINGDLYVHQRLFESYTKTEILNMSVSQYMAYDIVRNADTNIIRILDAQIAKNNLNTTNISQDIQRQQLAYVMIFAENNPLISQLEWTSKSSMNELMSYFKQYQDATTNIITKNIIAQAYKTLNRAIIDNMADTDTIESIRQRLGDLTGTGSVIEQQKNDAEIRARNGHKLAFVADINQSTADVATAAKYFMDCLNFTYTFKDGFSIKEFIAALQNINNYSDKGAALSKALSAYDAYRLDPVTRTVSKDKSDFLSSLNYFLSDNFNFQIAPNNVAVHTEAVEAMFNNEAIQTIMKSDIELNASDGENSRYKLSDFISAKARTLIGPTFVDYNIYFVRGTNAYGYTAKYATPVNGIGGYIIIDASNCETDTKLQKTVQHEIIHAIGNMTGFDNQLTDEVSAELLNRELAAAKKSTAETQKLKQDIAEYILATRYDGIKTEDAANARADRILINEDERQNFTESFYEYIFANEANAFAANVDEIEQEGNEFTQPYEYIGGKAFESPHNLYSQTFKYYDTNIMVIETRSDLGLLKRFNNQIINITQYSPETLKTELNDLSNNNTTRERAIRRVIDGRPHLRITSEGDITIVPDDFKKLLGDKYISDAQLQDKEFWLKNIRNKALRAAIAKTSNEQFGHIIEQYTGYRYDYVKRQFGESSYTDHEIAQLAGKTFAPEEDYTGALISGKKPRNLDVEAPIYSVYGSDIKGIVNYNAADKSASIQLGNVKVGDSMKALFKAIESKTKNVRYLVGSRTFATYEAAQAYKNTEAISTQVTATTQTGTAQFSTFDTLFDSLVSISAQTNKAILQNQYDKHNKAVDTIYITNDGKIYGFGFDGKQLQTIRDIAKNNGISEDILGKYAMNVDTGEAIINDEGLTEDLTRLLNAKRVVRMYRQGGYWVAYGIPNILQDRFLLNYGIESKNTSYISDSINVALVMSRTGEVSIAKTNADGTVEGKQVKWSGRKYYETVCRMLSRYNITDFKQLYKLGFSEDFVKKLQSKHGIGKGDIAAYVNDTSNTTMSRNVLIEAVWGKNSHLRSVEDIDSYLVAIQTYTPYMQYYGDTNTYQNVQALHDRYDKYMQTQNGNIKNIMNYVSLAFENSHGNIYSKLLDLDADSSFPYINNLDYSLVAFNLTLNAIREGWAKSKTESNTTQAEIQTSGMHADDESAVSKFDEYAAEHGLTPLSELSQISANELLEYVQTLNELPTSKERSELAQKVIDNWETYFDALDISDADENRLFNTLADIADEDYTDTTKIETAEQREQEKNLNEYLTSLKTDLDNIAKMEAGNKKNELRGKAFTAFQELKNNYEDYVSKYGEQGYKRIRQTYIQYGYADETNTASNYSKAKQRMQTYIAKALDAGKITAEQAGTINTELDKLDIIYAALSTRLDTRYEGRTQALKDFYTAYRKYISAKNESTVTEAISEFERLQKYLVKAALEGKVELSADYVDENGNVWPGEQTMIDRAKQLKADADTTGDYSKYREYLTNLQTNEAFEGNDFWVLHITADTLLDELDQTKPISGKPERRSTSLKPKISTNQASEVNLDTAAEQQDELAKMFQDSGFAKVWREENAQKGWGKTSAAQAAYANANGQIPDQAAEEKKRMEFSMRQEASMYQRQLHAAADSKPVTDAEVKDVLATIWNQISGGEYKFKVNENALNDDAKNWYKTKYEAEYKRIKTLKNLIETADASPEQRAAWNSEYEGLVKARSDAIIAYKDMRRNEASKLRDKIKLLESKSTSKMTDYEKYQHENELKELRNQLSTRYTFVQIVEKSFEDLDFHGQISDKQRKILSGLGYAYAKLVYSPQTQYTLDEFKGNVQSILEDGRLNERIPGSQELKIIDFNENLSDDQARAILEKFKNVEYTNKYDSQELIDIDQFAIMLASYTKKGLPEDLSEARERYGRKDMAVPELKPRPNDPIPRNDIAFNTKPISGKPKSKDLSVGSTPGGDLYNIFSTLSDLNTTSKLATDMLTGEIKYYPSSAKTTNSPKLNVNGIDLRQTFANFQVIYDKNGKIDSEKFVAQNADTLGQLQQSEKAAISFLDWAGDNPHLLDNNQLVLTAMLCNQIESSPKLTAETRKRAAEMFKELKSLGGRLLAINRNTGLTPLEEMAKAAMRTFNMSEKESNTLTNAILTQKQAIKNGNYKLADDAFNEALKIFEAHQSQLDTKINFFAKGLTEEQRAARFQNFADTITNWRYFAMLSSPSTFFAKNMAGNLMLKTLDKVSETIGKVTIKGTENLGNKINKSARIAKENYNTQVEAINEQLKEHKITEEEAAKQIAKAEATYTAVTYQYTVKPGSASENSKAAVQAALVDSGLVDSILAGTVSKYDRGYDVAKTHSLKNLDLDSGDIDAADMQMLKHEVTRRTPFGTSMAGQALNKYFNFIFDTMDKGDQKFVRKAIIDKTTKLVSDNLTEAEIQSIRDGHPNAETKIKLNDMIEYSTEQALQVYLRSTPAAYKTLMKFLEGHPAAKAIFSVICPFPRMLLNTISTGLSYSPVGFIKGLMTLRSDSTAFRNITANTQFAKAMTGTAVMAIGAILAGCGLIRLDDDDEYAGPQLILFNTFRVSLEDFSPASIPLLVGASLTSGTQEGGFWNGLTTAMDSLLDATIFGELTSIFGGNKTGTDIMANVFTNMVTQFIPSIMRNLAKTIDPYKKNYSGNVLQKFYKKLLAAIPGASFAVENKVDPYSGNYVTNYDDSNNATWSRLLTIFNTLSPTKVYRSVETELETESKAVGATTTGPSQTFTIDGTEYTIDDKTYYKYKVLRAKLYSQYASSLINKASYKKMTTEQKKAALKKLQNQATTNARLQLGIGQ